MSRFLFLRALGALGFLIACGSAAAQVGGGAVSYGVGGASQDFDTLASTGTSDVLPVGWYFREAGGSTTTTYQADDGTLNGGNVFSFGSAGSSERAFGTLATNSLGSSGSVVAQVGARLTNQSGAALTSLQVAFACELWRYQGNAADKLAFEYSTNATTLTDGTWTALAALDCVTPAVSGNGKKDGNLGANRTAVSSTIAGLNVSVGSSLWVRWSDTNIGGDDNSLAIDDVVFGTPVDLRPEVIDATPAGPDPAPVDSVITLTFSEPVDLVGTWYSFNCGSGTPTLSVSAGPASSYTLTPDGPLPYSGLCNLTVLADQVQDRDGSVDTMEFNYLLQFETEADHPPEVIATTPADGATNVARAADLSVTFSEPVDAPASAFAIFCPDSEATSLPFALDSEDDTTFVLDPASDLPAATDCRLYVDNLQVSDRDGEAQVPDLDTRVNFTTAALAPPAVISTVPAKNATNFPSAGDLQVVFDMTVTLAPGAFSLTCEQSGTPTLSHAMSGSIFTIGTGTALVAGESCTFTVLASAVTSGDGLNPNSDEIVNFTVATTGDAAYYQNVNLSSPGQLRCSLHQTIRGHTKYPYTASETDTWDILNLADEDPVDTGKILDLYRNASYTKISGGTGVYNREHTWPRTFGLGDTGTPGPATDTHMLHLTDTDYNTARLSRIYADCTAGCSEFTTVANHGFGGGGGEDSNYVGGPDGNSGSFEPWTHVKGNMARAAFYMAIRYEGGDGEPNLELTDTRAIITSTTQANGKNYMGLLTDLLAWHALDPVDEPELERNEVVYSFQSNRNPFVDHPEWVSRALFDENDPGFEEPVTCVLNTNAPAANDDSYATPLNTALLVAANDGVLDNDSDAEGAPLTAQLVSTVASGTLALAANGGFSYTPPNGFCGSTIFSYRASDGVRLSVPRTATIAVGSACAANSPPVADDATFTLQENSPTATPVGTVSASDPNVGDTLSYAITAGNASGAFAMSGNQVVVANPAPLDFETTPQFVLTVTVSDNGTPMLSDTAQITINLDDANDAPTVAQALADRSGQEGVAIVSFPVTDGFADADAGDVLEYTATGLPPGLTLDPSSGLVSGTPADGSAAGSVYSVEVTADDGEATASQSFQFTITAAGTLDPEIFGNGFEGEPGGQ